MDLPGRALLPGLRITYDLAFDSIGTMYAENAPELVYYAALYRIFNEFLDDISEDVLPNEGTGFTSSRSEASCRERV